jgi:RimJ/RimL family protein N-acetyltransferase
MDFRLRPTEPDDLEELVRISKDPQVSAQQYRLGRSFGVEQWRRALFEVGYRGPYTNSTILSEGRIAGFIQRCFWPAARREIRAAYSWNLAPEFWGRGLMPAVLTQDFVSHFAEPRLAEIDVDCFRDNLRCVRVLEKLAFRKVFISPFERVESMIRFCSSRWVLRYRLTRAMWDARTSCE